MDLTPSELLSLEADDAQAAITKVVQEMRDQLKAGADPRRLTQDYPWTAVGTAAVAGFVGAMLAVPSKEDAALKRLARIERALHVGGEDRTGADDSDASGKKSSRLLSLFGKRLFAAIRPALLASLTGALGAQTRSNGSNGSDGAVVEDEFEVPEEG